MNSTKKYIVITRPEKENKKLQSQLEQLGYNVFPFPSISIKKKKLSVKEKEYLKNVQSFNWVVFTSKNGIRLFIENLNEDTIDISLLKKVKIAAVGERTAKEIKKYRLPIHFIPSKFRTEYLANELPNVKDKKILLPRASIANPKLSQRLRERGAFVTDIAIYDTKFVNNVMGVFEKLLSKRHVACIMFTSPSTVKGFLINIKNSQFKKDILSLPIVSIGPVTTKTLKEKGFKNIYTADTYTIAKMLVKLQRNIL